MTTTNNKVLYHSKNDLHNDFLIFNSIGEAISIGSSYIGNAYIVSSKKLEMDGFIYDIFNQYHVYRGHIDNFTIFKFDDRAISYQDMINERLEFNEINDITCISAGVEIPIYLSVKSLTVNISNYEKEKLYLKINKKNRPVPESNLSVVQSGDSKYVIIDLSYLELESNFYVLEVYIGQLKIGNKYNFIIDKMSNYKCENINGSIVQSMVSDFFDEKMISQTKINLLKFPIEEISHTFLLNGHYITYKGILKSPHYLVNNIKYHISKYIWFEDLKDDIHFKVQNLKSIKIQLPEKKPNYFHLDETDINSFTIKYNDILGIVNSTDSDYFIFHIKNYRGNIYECMILVRNIVAPNLTNITIENNCYFLNLNLIGDNVSNLHMKFGNNLVFTAQIEKSSMIKLPIHVDKLYYIEIFDGTQSFFSTKKKKVIYKTNYQDHSINSIIHKTIKIESAYTNLEESEVYLKSTYIENIRYIDEKIYGDIYYKDISGTQYYPTLTNPVILEFYKGIHTYNNKKLIKTEVYITDKDHDGILVDSKQSQLCFTENKKMNDAIKFDVIIMEE